jgi:gentisate 1,2-dioxygenase
MDKGNNSYVKAYEYQKNVDPHMKEIITVTKNYNDFDFSNKINFVDFSQEYNLDYKLTSPNILSGFIKLQKDDLFDYEKYYKNSLINKEYLSDFNASSNIFYIIEGEVTITFSYDKYGLINKDQFHANVGDIVVLPHFTFLEIKAMKKTSIFYVNDSPLLNYLGTNADENKKRFQHCHYTKEFLMNNLEELSDKNNNRKGILLGNEDTEKIGTKTITHSLWALYNELPTNTNQRVHKHNSIAIDFCLHSPDENNVFTLVGDELDENNNIINPEIFYWKSGSLFITPPGKWHSHHNRSDENAYVLPIQDAGLLIYQRILGITLK